MTPEQFQHAYPLLAKWIAETLSSFAPLSRPASTYNFKRLPRYFEQSLLNRAMVVPVEHLPMPPLTKMGLESFSAFENGDFAGITYLNTFFVKPSHMNESLFCHELIHVIQWDLLGPERFLATYADGLERFGYASSPLEAMAYNAQRLFEADQDFDAMQFVSQQLVHG